MPASLLSIHAFTSADCSPWVASFALGIIHLLDDLVHLGQGHLTMIILTWLFYLQAGSLPSQQSGTSGLQSHKPQSAHRAACNWRRAPPFYMCSAS